MAEPFGFLVVHVNKNVLFNSVETFTYEWRGAPVTVIYAKYLDLDIKPDAKIIELGPFRMKVLEFYPESFGFKCVRMDYPFWHVISFAHKYSRLLRVMYARFILTLVVWGFADHHPGFVPSYRDIYLARWFINLFRKA